MSGAGDPGPRRRRTLLVAAVAWIAVGVILLVVVGGATGFIPDDPIVPEIGFVDAGDGRVALEIGPRSFAAAKGIEVRSGSAAGDGRMLWRVTRGSGSGSGDGRVVVGETPDGFEEAEPLEADLPRLWHAEVDNRCYYGSSVVPDRLSADTVTLSSGEQVTVAGFRDGDRGFSSCDTNSLGSRLAAFAGLLAIAVGGVLVMITWWDLRRGSRSDADPDVG